MPTYAALDETTWTLYVLRQDHCEPEEHSFGNGTDALDWLRSHVTEAHTIPLASFNGLAKYRAQGCNDSEERTSDRT